MTQRKWRPNLKWFQYGEIDSNNKEEVQKFTERILSATDLFNVVLKYIEEKEEEMNKQETRLEDFEDNAWPYKQAHRAGKRAAFRELKEFLPDPYRENK